MKTSGRIPSTGSIYPLRVMGMGKPDNIKWYIVQADGTMSDGFIKASSAFTIARMMNGLGVTA